MKFSPRFTSSLLMCIVPFVLLAQESDNNDQETDFQRILSGRDYPAVKEFLFANEGTDLAEKSLDLNISGDVRPEWSNIHEWARGVSLRGGGAIDIDGIPISTNDFDVEYNFRLDYVTDDAWARAHLRFDNGMGTGNPTGEGVLLDPENCFGSGDSNKVNLRAAYIGYKVCADGTQRLDVELGRRKLFQVLDSYIQFLSRFDGAYIHYTRDMKIWDLDLKFLSGVVDERVNQFFYAGQISFLDIYNTGLDLKYSLVHWRLLRPNRAGVPDAAGWRFINSQATLQYHVPPSVFSTPVNLFAGFVYNHAAKKIGTIPNLTLANPNKPEFPLMDAGKITINSKKNIGWYAGVLFGEVFQEGDYAFNLNYQVVQAQAISDCDMGGIGRGNTLDTTFTRDYEGNVNFRGWHFSFLYALTDNLSIETTWESSSADDPRIGGTHEYSLFVIQAIFAF